MQGGTLPMGRLAGRSSRMNSVSKPALHLMPCSCSALARTRFRALLGQASHGSPACTLLYVCSGMHWIVTDAIVGDGDVGSMPGISCMSQRAMAWLGYQGSGRSSASWAGSRRTSPTVPNAAPGAT